MSEVTRKLASIRRVKSKEPIEGADRIELVKIDGWQCVAQKDVYQPGQLVVFFEVDSFLPVRPEFEFLRPSSFRSTQHLGDGFRIKSVKLRKTLSQGLLLPLDEAFGNDYGGSISPVEGVDVTEFLGVQKWEQPLSPQLAGQAKGNFPSFIRKTDQERIQNCYNSVVREHCNKTFDGTLKLDGSSMTVYLKDGEFGVCSRNLDLKETEGNTFWKVARVADLEGVLRRIGRNLALQGELMGPGVQGNRENFKDHKFFLFDVWDIDEQRYLHSDEIGELDLPCDYDYDKVFCKVPHLASVSRIGGYTLDELLELSNIESINHKIGEGIVYRCWDDPNVSFKVLNNEFLLAEK